MEPGGLEDSDFDPQEALKGAREFLKGVSYELAEAQSSPYIMSWGTTSNASNSALAQASSFQYVVRIAYEGPLGFRLLLEGGKCRVVEVIPQSQAQLSGVDVGDIVLAINKIDAPSSLAELKRMTNTRPVTLTMRREASMNDPSLGPSSQRSKVVEQQRRAQASASVAQQQDQQMRQIQHFRQLQMQQFQQFLMQQQQHSSPVPMPTSTSPGANSSFQRMQSLQPHLLQQQFSSTMDNSGISTAAATSMMGGYGGPSASSAFIRDSDMGRRAAGIEETITANWTIQGYTPGDMAKRKPQGRHQPGRNGLPTSPKIKNNVDGSESRKANMIHHDGESLRRELMSVLSASEDHFVSVRLTGDSLTKVSRGVAALMATWRPTASLTTMTDWEIPEFHVVHQFFSTKEAQVLRRIFDDAVPNTTIRPGLNCSFKGLLRLLSSRASKLVFESFQQKELYDRLEVVEMRNHHSSFYDLGLIESSVGFTLDPTSTTSERLFRMSPQEQAASMSGNSNNNKKNIATSRKTLRVVAQVFVAQNSPIFKPALV